MVFQSVFPAISEDKFKSNRFWANSKHKFVLLITNHWSLASGALVVAIAEKLHDAIDTFVRELHEIKVSPHKHCISSNFSQLTVN